MKHSILPAGFLCLVAGVAPAASATRVNDPAPLRTVNHVDLTRYAGTWYEIASYPQRFQKGCTGTTAVYTRCGRTGRSRWSTDATATRSTDARPSPVAARA